jgi:integrase
MEVQNGMNENRALLQKTQAYRSTGVDTEPRKFALTEKRIARFPRPEGSQRTYYYDTTVPGLAVAVSASGEKSYLMYCRMQGRPEKLTIGKTSKVTLDAARKQAKQWNSDIAGGLNPAAERRSVRAEQTLGELFQRYLSEYAEGNLRPATIKNYRSMFSAHLEHWKSKKLPLIHRADVVGLHVAIGKKGKKHTANRVVELLSAMFARARRDWNYAGPNPAEGIEGFRERQRERYLGDSDPEEPRRFFAALRQEDKLWQDFFSVCVLTGARVSNCEAMAWSEVDLQRQQWTIPAAKAKEDEPIRVVLSDDVLPILESRKDNGSEWVFPSPRKGTKTGHITESKSAWGRILDNAKIENLHVHDLRRTFGSYQIAGGASLAMVGKALGHASGSNATAIYARLNLDPIRASIAKATAAIMAAGEPKALESDNG